MLYQPHQQIKDKSGQENIANQDSINQNLNLSQDNNEVQQIIPKQPRKYKKRQKKEVSKKIKRNYIKHPHAPKQNRSAYNFYLQDQIPILRQSQPELQYKEIVSILSKQWKNDELQNQDRQQYEQLAAEDLIRYIEEKREFCKKYEEVEEKDSQEVSLSDYGSEQNKSLKKQDLMSRQTSQSPVKYQEQQQFTNIDNNSQSNEEFQEQQQVYLCERNSGLFEINCISIKKQDLKFKRPCNPYISYCKHQLKCMQKQYPDLEPRELNQMIAKQWKTLESDQKLLFQKEYKEALKDYQQKKKDHLYFQLEKRKIHLTENFKPYKKQRSAYQFFCSESLNSEEYQEIQNPRDRIRAISQAWKNIDIDDLDRFNEMNNQDGDRFLKDVQEYQRRINGRNKEDQDYLIQSLDKQEKDEDVLYNQ
eukprot:403334490